MKYKTITAIGLALKAKEITEEQAVKAYKLLQVNKETQKLVKQLNAAANAAGFKKLTKLK
jgi:aspartate carbamoyltransferase regulatory subunit